MNMREFRSHYIYLGKDIDLEKIQKDLQLSYQPNPRLRDKLKQ
jgi:hypothetical protein